MNENVCNNSENLFTSELNNELKDYIISQDAINIHSKSCDAFIKAIKIVQETEERKEKRRQYTIRFVVGCISIIILFAILFS